MIIYHTNGPRLLDLIYVDHLATLSDNAREIMERSLRNSPEAWVAYHADELVAYCGVIPPTILSDTAYLWMYTTPNFAKHWLVCVRHSRELIADVLRCYPILVGHCNENSAKWLRWLGAFVSAEPQSGFIPFEIKAP